MQKELKQYYIDWFVKLITASFIPTFNILVRHWNSEYEEIELYMNRHLNPLCRYFGVPVLAFAEYFGDNSNKRRKIGIYSAHHRRKRLWLKIAHELPKEIKIKILPECYVYLDSLLTFDEAYFKKLVEFVIKQPETKEEFYKRKRGDYLYNKAIELARKLGIQNPWYMT